MYPSINVWCKPLRVCCNNPTTGFFRNGCCDTSADDVGQHLVCVQITESFLRFSKSVGNDLSTPVPEYQFPGLTEGDKWCLCANRWKQAYDAGCAPQVYLGATHHATLDIIPLDILEAFAIDSL